jgi:hypothetical protein
MLVAYVSGHGFGHATRVAEVLRVVREREPRLGITVVTSAPAGLFHGVVREPLEVRALECDVGLVQKDALTLDETATAQQWKEFHVANGDRVDAEWRWLYHAGARVILGDVPPLAFEAAAEVGVPSIALANFSWDWIYRHLAREQAALAAAADWAAAAYARAGLLLRLPFAGDLSAFPKAVDIPLVARRPRVARGEVRRVLGLGAGPVALVSFGGIGVGSFALRVLAGIAEVQFVAVGLPGPAPPNVRLVTAAEMAGLGLRYEDVVGAADVVVTKPGYGIVSDAIAAGVRIVYTERGDFPEYPLLVAGMARCVPAAHVSNLDLMTGNLREPLRAVLSQPVPPPPDLSGAAAAAEWLLETAARSV